MAIFRSKPSINITDVPEDDLKILQHDVSMYEDRPNGDVHLREFEIWSNERIEVLMMIKAGNDKGYARASDDWKKYIHGHLSNGHYEDYIRLLYVPNFNSTLDDIRRRRKDILSHYTLVFALCSDEKIREWFMRLEIDMFRLRFSNLNDTGIREFLKINESNLNLKKLTQIEKTKYHEDLFACTSGLEEYDFENVDFYKVHFTAASDLLVGLNCFIRRGFLYVPHFNIVYVLEGIFEKRLKKRLLYFHEAFRDYHDERLAFIIHQVIQQNSTHLFNNDTGICAGTVPLPSLDSLSQTSFPLCARNLYEAMKRFHHLRYQGRQLLQLFLKGIGLSVQDALQLFRNEFTKIMKNEVFDQEYAYNIRHNYGLEGSRINYQPPGCENVIESIGSPIQRQFHGCPFAQWDTPLLTKRLSGCDLAIEDISEIIELSKEGHARLACSKFFEYTHGGTSATINHPNQFFEESRQYYLKLNSCKEQKSQPSTSELMSSKEQELPLGTSKIMSSKEQEPQPSTSKTMPSKKQESQPSTSKLMSSKEQKPQASTSKTMPSKKQESQPPTTSKTLSSKEQESQPSTSKLT